MIVLIDESAEFMKQNHPRGEFYYLILYHYYLSPKEISTSAIIDEVEKTGIVLCDKTLRKYRNEAIGVLGEILWGYEDRESDSILEKIDSRSQYQA